MTEVEFIKFYKKRNHLRTHKEAKEKIELFWSALLKVLIEDGRVSIKNWGTFELKEVKSRKTIDPRLNKTVYSKDKKTIKFRTGAKLQKRVNGAEINE